MKKLINYCAVFVFMFTSICVIGNEPLTVEWSSVEIKAENSDLGKIKVVAGKDENAIFSLLVDSKYGLKTISSEMLKDIVNPNIKSLSIQYETPYEGGKIDQFSICLLYGKHDRINVGSELKPKYRWKQSQVTFIFSEIGVSRDVYKGSEQLRISSCNLR